MRILYLTQYFNLPDEPGSSRHYQFARAWVEQGHEVLLVTGNVNYKTGETVPTEALKSYSSYDHPDGFRVLRLWTYSRFKGSFKKRLLFFGSFAVHAAALGAFLPQPDLVFASSTPLTIGVPGIFLARRFGVPFVFELRDLWPEAAVAAGVMRDQAWIDRTTQLARYLYARADHLVAVTEGIREGLLAHGAPVDEISLVPNGVDHWMDRDRFADRNPLSRFSDKFICLYVGAHGIWNDLGTLLAGAESLRDPDVAFVFVGDGDHRPELERRARESGLENVHFLGALPKEDAFAAICHSDLALISASAHDHNEQTLPNKIFDYMAAEVPVVIAAGKGEMRRLIDRSGGGWYCAPEEGPALAETITKARKLSVEERRTIGRHGRKYVLDHYSRPELARRLVSVFESLIAGRPVRPVSPSTPRPDLETEDSRPISRRGAEVPTIEDRSSQREEIV